MPGGGGVSDYDARTASICRILHDEARGPENAISSAELADRVGIDDGEARPVTRRLVRQVMEYHLLPIASTNEGYFICDDPTLAKDELASLDHRIGEIEKRKELFEQALTQEQTTLETEVRP